MMNLQTLEVSYSYPEVLPMSHLCPHSISQLYYGFLMCMGCITEFLGLCTQNSIIPYLGYNQEWVKKCT